MMIRNVSISGIGSTEFGKLRDRTIGQLAVDAAEVAIKDSAVDRRDIGAIYLGNFVSGMLTGQEILAGLVGDNLGLGNIPCTKVEGACASGGIAFRHAYLAVATGLYNAALVVGVEKMTHRQSDTITQALNCAIDQSSDGPSGLTFPGLYAMAWRSYDQRYGAPREDVSAIILKNKGNGRKNPLAQMKVEVKAEDILNSPLIADPLRLFDCCPVSDGASSLLLVASDLLPEKASWDIRVAASVQTSGSARLAGRNDFCSFDATVAASRGAFKTAKISPEDIDLVELHDCFSIAEALDCEDLGLVERGMGLRLAVEGLSQVDGKLPINPSGGLLAKGHPVGATGVSQIYEAVLQLRGLHANQVHDPEFALTHNLGGAGVACTVNIIKRAS